MTFGLRFVRCVKWPWQQSPYIRTLIRPCELLHRSIQLLESLSCSGKRVNEVKQSINSTYDESLTRAAKSLLMVSYYVSKTSLIFKMWPFLYAVGRLKRIKPSPWDVVWEHTWLSWQLPSDGRPQLPRRRRCLETGKINYF